PLAVPAHLLGATAELPTYNPLPLWVAGRSTQVEKRRVDIAAQVARVVLERFVILLKVPAEAAGRRGPTRNRRPRQAYTSTPTAPLPSWRMAGQVGPSLFSAGRSRRKREPARAAFSNRSAKAVS